MRIDVDTERQAKPRRVLYVARTAKGGSAVSLYHLVTNLDRTRYEPAVLFYSQEDSHVQHKLSEGGVQVTFLETGAQEASPRSSEPAGQRDIGRWLGKRFGQWARGAYASLKAGYVFLRRDAGKVWPIVSAIRVHQVDLVHLNNGLRHNKPAIVAAWLTRTPCVCHVRMFEELSGFDRFFARFVKVFVFNSSAVAAHHTARGIPSGKGTVIHNAVDLDEFSQQYDPASVRSEFGWNARERVIGVVGRLDWWKGHDTFLQAISEIARDLPEVRGLIVGAPEESPRNREYHETLLALNRSLNLGDRVVFTGFRGDVPRLMSAMDIVVLPSSTPEPFGRVVIEGMAAGKPVVATAAGGVLDIIEDGINGVLVPCQDATSMASEITGLLRDRKKAAQIGEAARRRAESRFSVQAHADAVQGIYDSMLRTVAT